MDNEFIREALLQEKVGNKVRCNLCERRCQIPQGGFGWCRTRQNSAGKLITLVYGAISSFAANPIEKKPLYHFYPGTIALTVGSWSCNFGCPWCRNWKVSKVKPEPEEYISPERAVEMAENASCQGLSISFNEPTLLFEWVLDAFRLAQGRGLYNTIVTNSYMTRDAMTMLVEAGLDAMSADIKGDATTVRKYCRGVKVEKVWNTVIAARQAGVHLEITTPVIPTVNDSGEILQSVACRIAQDLGREVPWHLTAYFPAYRFALPPTPVDTLEWAWEIGKNAGLDYVYIDNVPGHDYQNTYCPACNASLLQRSGLQVFSNWLDADSCPYCGCKIVGTW